MDRKFKAACPICGYGLCKGTPQSQIDINCPKCGEYLQVRFLEDGVSSSLVLRKAEGKAAERAAQ